MRLHLIELLDLQSSPTVLPLSLSHHVETDSSPLKNTLWVRLLSDTSTLVSICTLAACECIFWWRCRTLPPGPQCLCYEGITTISLLYDTLIYVSTRSDPPPRLENVETIKTIRTQWLPQLHQWQNCSLDSFVVPPCFQLDHGIQQQGHCDYWTHDPHD